MEAVGLLDVSLGRNSQAIDFVGGQKPVHSPGFATRFRPTATMATMALEAGIGESWQKASVKADAVAYRRVCSGSCQASG
mgnify:CR=1 FL=1